jgi:hypothetical protein
MQLKYKFQIPAISKTFKSTLAGRGQRHFVSALQPPSLHICPYAFFGMRAKLDAAICTLIVREVGGMVSGYSVVRVDTGPHRAVCCVEAAAAAQVCDFFGGVVGVGGGVLEEMQDTVYPPLLLSLSKDLFDRVPRSVPPMHLHKPTILYTHGPSFFGNLLGNLQS